MKNIFLLFSLLITSFAEVFADIHYVVKGEIEDHEGQIVEIYDYETYHMIDSVLVGNGKFRLEEDYPRNAYVRVEVNRTPFANVALDSLVIPNFNNHLPEPTSELNNRLLQYTSQRDSMLAELKTYRKNLAEQGLSEDEVKENYKAYYKKREPEFMEFYKKAIKDNPDVISEVVLMDLASHSIMPDVWAEFYSLLSEDVKNLPSTQNRNNRFQNMKRVLPGNMFVDLEGKNLDGETVHLSDYLGKGKYVLVDFWASWCGPCLEEGKNTLIPLYEKYKDTDNFEILGVATWDNPDNTKERIGQQGYKWPQIIDAGSTPMELYGFDGVPMIMLFDPDGKILERNLRGEGIIEALEKYLN